MLRKSDILTTVRMFQEENLDVRTITMGINVSDCAGRSIAEVSQSLEQKIELKAGNLVRICDQVSGKYGIKIANKRIAVSPISNLLEGHSPAAALKLAKALDSAASAVHVDLIGGFSALVQRGTTPGERVLIESLPAVLSKTSRVCASINVATSKAGINVDAIILVAKTILKIAEATRSRNGFGAAKLVVFANIPEDNPFMAGAYLGSGQPEFVINVGVSGPGVVKRAVERLLARHPKCALNEIAEEVKHTAFRVTRVGELIGREIAERLGIPFGVVDLSLAPSPRIGDSVGEIYQAMGISDLGAPGTTAAVALLNDAVKKGGAFASSSVGGLSGAFLPVTEDPALAEAVAKGTLSLEKLEALTSVCSVGLDMVLLPGDTTMDTIAGLLIDEASIGVINRKTTAARLIPVPGKQLGDPVDFGGLFGKATVTAPASSKGASAFILRGGQIPAPLQSLSN